ncbi:MAG: hypothetical protein ABL974_14675, partial [Prosthecobacter sp.]
WKPRLVILNGDGSVQIELMTALDYSAGHVTMLAALPDGRICAGGDFEFVWDDGSLHRRRSLARISGTPQTYQRLEVSASGRVITWSRRLLAARVEEVVFEVADSNGNWLPLGPATRIGTTDDWAKTGLSLPPGQRQIRARSRAAGGGGSWHQFTSWADVPETTPYGDWQEARYGIRSGDALSAAAWATGNDIGEPNLLIYAFDGIPRQLWPQAITLTGGVNAYQFPLNVGAADVIVTVQTASNLTGIWTDIAHRIGNAVFTALVPGITLNESGGMVTISTSGVAAPTQFYRLSLRLVAP